MPAIRRPIQPTLKGNVYLARFKHPVLKRTVCFTFGTAAEADTNTKALNTIFMNPALWHNPPAPPETPEPVYRQWMGKGNVVTLAGGVPKRGGKVLKADAVAVARLEMERDALRVQLQNAFNIIAEKERELEHWRGKKTNKGPAPTLERARLNFMKDYAAGKLRRGSKAGTIPDADAVKNIKWDLERLTAKFEEQTPADIFEGVEGAEKLNDWIHGLKNAEGKMLSATRRMQIRVYALKMLEHAGVAVERKLVARPDMNASSMINDTTKQGNGVIVYLTKEEAERVAEKLAQPWADLFRVQLQLGLRPDECLTLHKNNFGAGLTTLKLTPLAFKDRFGAMFTLTLKTGPRELPIPEAARDIIKPRLRNKGGVVFPDADGFAWNDPKKFNRQYKAALVKAAKQARVKKTMDSRIARRTCASLLMQAGESADRVAALLGNSAAMIRKHYGDPGVLGMDLSGTAV